MGTLFVPVLGLLVFAAAQGQVETPQGGTPVYKVTAVSRTVKAINYHHRTGTTPIDFRGTSLMPAAKGRARVESRMGSTKIETEVEHLLPPGTYGPEFLTYVLWGVTPEGRAQNLGELAPDGDHAKLLSTTELSAFGLIVTAEPYFAVTQPSDVVVMENFVREDTTGTIQPIEAKYELLPRGAYTMNRTDLAPVRIDPKGPLQLAEAENAVRIAKLAGAEHAADTLQKAQVDLQNAQGLITRGNTRKQAETAARGAAQSAEDARLITIRKLREERLAQERAAAAQREAEANAQAEQEAQRRAAAEADAKAQTQARAAAEAEQQRSERARLEAELAAERAARERVEADHARQEADRARQQAENEKTEMRTRLLQQLNAVLETRDTARGLIVNMADVLFDTGSSTLRPAAREKLARVAGIVQSQPGLRLEVEGHTDSVGGEEYNQRLSERRAEAVREYLVGQGLPADSVTARGFGKENPVASNDTASGRQQNRRVEMVVSGEAIGQRLGGSANAPVPNTDGPVTH